MQQRRRESWSKWRGLLADQAASRQSIAAFCRERGVPVSQFFAWKKRLRAAAARPFLEVQLVETKPPSGPVSGGAIEVVLAGGHRVRVEPGFAPDHLRAVVAALETPA